MKPDTVRNWGKTSAQLGEIEAYRDALESTLGPGSLETLADEADLHINNFVADAHQLYRNFMAAAAS